MDAARREPDAQPELGRADTRGMMKSLRTIALCFSSLVVGCVASAGDSPPEELDGPDAEPAMFRDDLDVEVTAFSEDDDDSWEPASVPPSDQLGSDKLNPVDPTRPRSPEYTGSKGTVTLDPRPRSPEYTGSKGTVTLDPQLGR